VQKAKQEWVILIVVYGDNEHKAVNVQRHSIRIVRTFNLQNVKREYLMN